MPVKIYLKLNEHLIDFMWADTGKDGSVYMGLKTITSSGSIEKIFDPEGELLPGKDFNEINTIKTSNPTKISYHSSGKFKLETKIKREFFDRVTVQGPALKDISEPTHMLEILFPANLKISKTTPHPQLDQIIDLTNFPSNPLRCTVSCMPSEQLANFLKNKIVETSIIETTRAYEFNNLTWTWTLRISRDDKLAYETRYIFFLPFKIIWPTS